MDWMQLIKDLGGGVGATALVLSVAANAVQYRRNSQLQDRFVDHLIASGKEIREAHTAFAAILSAATTAMEAAVRAVERRP